jgi:hypothetical protein
VTDLPAQGEATPEEPERNADYVTLFFGVGRRDGANFHELQAALDGAGIGAEVRGRILVKQNHSFVEVLPDVQQRAIEALNGSTICGRAALVEVARPRDRSA